MSADRGQTNVLVVKAVCVFILAALAAFVFVRMRDRGPQDVEPAATTGEPASSAFVPVETAADGGATAEPAARLPRLLDFGSTTCTQCKLMAPILDEMTETFAGRLEVRFIDVRKDKAAAERHGVQIIPTQIFFDASGKELFRHQGFFSREDILAKWAELGVELDG